MQIKATNLLTTLSYAITHSDEILGWEVDNGLSRVTIASKRKKTVLRILLQEGDRDKDA